jgi:hypothetical protein
MDRVSYKFSQPKTISRKRPPRRSPGRHGRHPGTLALPPTSTSFCRVTAGADYRANPLGLLGRRRRGVSPIVGQIGARGVDVGGLLKPVVGAASDARSGQRRLDVATSPFSYRHTSGWHGWHRALDARSGIVAVDGSRGRRTGEVVAVVSAMARQAACKVAASGLSSSH